MAAEPRLVSVENNCGNADIPPNVVELRADILEDVTVLRPVVEFLESGQVIIIYSFVVTCGEVRAGVDARDPLVDAVFNLNQAHT